MRHGAARHPLARPDGCGRGPGPGRGSDPWPRSDRHRSATRATRRIPPGGEAPPSKWLLLADHSKSLLILVLVAASVLAGAVGDIKDTVVMLVVVILNVLLGFWQEHRAEATLSALKKMLSPTAQVRRDGSVQEIPASALVPGDIILLEAGDRVPADGRILAAHNTELDDSTLTGESQPVGKDARAQFPPKRLWQNASTWPI